MKIALVAVVGLVLGLGFGTGVSAFRVKAEILEAHEQARADSLAAHPDAAVHGDDGSVTVVLPPEEASDTVAAEDTAESHDTTPADTASEDRQSTNTTEPATEAATPSAPAGVTPDSAAGTGASSAKTPVGAPREVLNVDGAKKLSKIFGAMKPADAAAVLTQMTDDEIVVILRQMSERQAGPIVSAFPPTRAAELGSALLTAREGGS